MATEDPTPAQRRALDNLIIGLPADHHVTAGAQRSSWHATWKSIVRQGWVSPEGLLTQAGLEAIDAPGVPHTNAETVLASLRRYGPASATTLRIRLHTHDMLLARVLETLQTDLMIAIVRRPITGVVYGVEGWQNFPSTTWRFPCSGISAS